MFAPISARLASSFSRKGIMAEATETMMRGLMSMKSTRSRSTSMISSRWRQVMRWLMRQLFSSTGSVASATV